MRPSVTPSKTVNLSQLTVELGGAGLCRNEETGEIVAAEGAAITQQQLEDAVSAHVAVFPEPPPTLEELATEVRGIRERAAAADVSDPDARMVRDAVAGQ